MEVVERIKERRKELKITQKEMAEVLGISQAAYAKIEKGNVTGGTKSISIINGKCIAETLKISFNELFEIEIPDSIKPVDFQNEKEKLEEEVASLKEQLGDKREVNKALKDTNEYLKMYTAFTILVLKNPEYKGLSGKELKEIIEDAVKSKFGDFIFLDERYNSLQVKRINEESKD